MLERIDGRRCRAVQAAAGFFKHYITPGHRRADLRRPGALCDSPPLSVSALRVQAQVM